MRKMKRGDKIKLHSTENSGTKIEMVKEPTSSQRNPEKASNAIRTQVKQQEKMDFLRDQRNNTQHLLPPCFASIMKRKGGVQERPTKHWSLRTAVGRRQSAAETEPKPFTLSNHRTPTPPRRICQGIASHGNKRARHHGANEHGVSSSGKNPKHVTLQNQHQSKHNPTAIDRTRKKSQKEPGKMSSFCCPRSESKQRRAPKNPDFLTLSETVHSCVAWDQEKSAPTSPSRYSGVDRDRTTNEHQDLLEIRTGEEEEHTRNRWNSGLCFKK